MQGRLIVFEGTDGSGKATQSALLCQELTRRGVPFRKLEFPRYQEESSALIRLYLGGAFGSDPDDVNAYAASTFYSVDRYASYKQDWGGFYESGGLLIADRYTTSNMVHQMTKYEDEVKRKDFLSWLEKTEYGELELPRPDLVILLDIPLAVSENLVKERAKKGGSMDIHEQHLDYLRKCHDAYRQLVALYHWKRIPCTEEGRLRSIENIGKDVEKAVAAVME